MATFTMLFDTLLLLWEAAFGYFSRFRTIVECIPRPPPMSSLRRTTKPRQLRAF
jgi:hypothetical protein